MTLVLAFVVFLIAALVACMAAEGRASLIARLVALASRAGNAGRTLAGHGADLAERAVAELASDSRTMLGLDQPFRMLRRGTGSGPNRARER